MGGGYSNPVPEPTDAMGSGSSHQEPVALSIPAAEPLRVQDVSDPPAAGSEPATPPPTASSLLIKNSPSGTWKPASGSASQRSRLTKRRSFAIGPGSEAGTVRLPLGTDRGAVVGVDYAAQTRGVQGKDQDRYSLYVPSGGKKGMVLGIFDGHSVHDIKGGRQHAESAATRLPEAIHRAAAAVLSKGEASPGASTSSPACVTPERPLMAPDAPLVVAFAKEFGALQSSIESQVRAY